MLFLFHFFLGGLFVCVCVCVKKRKINVKSRNNKQMKQIIEKRKRDKYWLDKLNAANEKLETNNNYKNSYETSLMEEDKELTFERNARYATFSFEDPRKINVWINADCQGSIETIQHYLNSIKFGESEDYQFQIIHAKIGLLFFFFFFLISIAVKITTNQKNRSIV